MDGHDRAVLNLVPSDLEVFDEADGRQKALKPVVSLRMIDPSSASPPPDLERPDFFGVVVGSCALAYTAHYQLAYSPGPDGTVSGIHTVEIRTRRRGVKLSYRHGYFVSPPDRGISIPIAMVAKSDQEPVNATVQVGRGGTIVSLGENSFGTTTPSPTALCGDV